MRKYFFKRSICLCLLTLTAVISTNAQKYSIVSSPDKIWRIAVPIDWKAEPESGEFAFRYFDPQSAEKMLHPRIFLITDKGPYDNIRNVVARSGVVLNADKENPILDTGFVMFNNKEWFWTSKVNTITKGYVLKIYSLETTHNGVYYKLSFSDKKEHFNLKKDDLVSTCLHSFMFLSKDADPTATASPQFSSEKVNETLKKIQGIYRFNYPDIGESYQSIIIEKPAESSNYTARVINALISKEANFDVKLEGTLKVTHIDEATGLVVFSTDAIKSLSGEGTLLMEKLNYQLKFVNNKLEGRYYHYTGDNQNPAASSIRLTRTGDPVIQNTTNPSSNKGSVKAGSSKGQTYGGWANLSAKSEAENIRLYGQGKVRRLSQHQIEFTLTTGRKLVVNDKYEAKTKLYEWAGLFLGYLEGWNSFILQKEDGWISLVNRTTGVVSDDLYLDDIVPVGGEEAEGSFSPDHQWLFVQRSFEEDEITAHLVVYSVEQGFKKTFERQFTIKANDPQTWLPTGVKWADNHTIEIKKLNGKEKIIGTVWLNLRNNEWILSDSRTSIKEEQVKNQPAGTGKSFNLDHRVVGTVSLEELARKVLNALKTNNFESYLECIAEENTNEAKKGFTYVKQTLESQGVTNWSKFQFDRVGYSKEWSRENVLAAHYIDFNYGSNYTGRIGGNGAIKQNGRYFLSHAFDTAGMRRK